MHIHVNVTEAFIEFQSKSKFGHLKHALEKFLI